MPLVFEKSYYFALHIALQKESTDFGNDAITKNSNKITPVLLLLLQL